MTYFRDAINSRAKENIVNNPFIVSSYVVKTADIIATERTNQYFYSLNHMSMNDMDALLKYEPIMTGLTFVADQKGMGGSSRDGWGYMNPKFTNTKEMGDGTGKLGQHTYGTVTADLMFSGANNMAPTVVGTQQMGLRVSDKIHSTEGMVARNTDLTDAARAAIGGPGTSANSPNTKAAATGTMVGMLAGVSRATAGQTLPAVKDPKTNKPLAKDPTQRGPYANPIRTGTACVPPTELSFLAMGGIY